MAQLREGTINCFLPLDFELAKFMPSRPMCCARPTSRIQECDSVGASAVPAGTEVFCLFLLSRNTQFASGLDSAVMGKPSSPKFRPSGKREGVRTGKFVGAFE